MNDRFRLRYELRDKPYRSLNLGCGNDMTGTHRIDIFKTKATTEIADFEKGLPYPDNYFNVIYCKSVLEHIKNLGLFVDEIYRVLKPDGKILLRTDYAGFLFAHIWEKHEPNRAIDIQYEAGGFGHKGKKKDFQDHHYHLFVASHLKYLFVKFRGHNFSYIKNGTTWYKTLFYNLLPKNLGAYHIEMVAWK